ncbi:MAG TPA: hypothetical protein DEP84_01150, partial [Chloroflexi bacterium]|nr:hypothetical protein [Chloroflexota bacterium]
PFGPAVEALSGPATIFRPEPAVVTATVRDDRGAGSHSVVSATLALTDGMLIAPFRPLDGAWSDSTEAVSATLTLTTAIPGLHLLVAQAVDGDGSVGVPSALLLTVYDGRLRLTVRDTFGRAPIAGATVRLISGENVQEATTDAAGAATLDTLSGPAAIQVLAADYQPLTTTVTLLPDRVSEQTLELRRILSQIFFPVARRGE